MPAPSTSSAHLFVAGCLNFLLLGAAVSTGGFYGVILHKQFGQGPTASPQLAQVFFVGSAVVIISAALAHKVFAKPWLPRTCSALYLAGALTCSVARDWNTLLAGWFLMGCANGGLGTWFNGEVARTRTGPWLAVLNGFWAIGAVLGPQLLGRYLQNPMASFWILAGASAFVLLLTLPMQVSSHNEEEAGTALTPSIPPSIFVLAAMMALYVGIESTVFVFISQFLIQARSFEGAGVASAGSSMMLSFAIGRFLLGALSAKISPRKATTLSAALAVAGGACLVTPGTTMAGIWLLGFAMGPIFPTLVAWVSQVTNQTHRGTAILTTGGVVAAAAVPPALTMLLISAPGTLPFWVVGAFGALSLVAFSFKANRLQSADQ